MADEMEVSVPNGTGRRLPATPHGNGQLPRSGGTGEDSKPPKPRPPKKAKTIDQEATQAPGFICSAHVLP